jgi:hypothetical protein
MATKFTVKDERKGTQRGDYEVIKDHVKELERELHKHEQEPINKAHPPAPKK